MPYAVVMRHGATIRGAMLTVVSRSFYMAGRNRDGLPAFADPARVINVWRVIVAGNFATDRPIQTEDGWRMHGRLLL